MERQTYEERDRQAAHSVEQKHQELDGCHGYTPGASLLLSLYVYCSHVSVNVRGLSRGLQPGHRTQPCISVSEVEKPVP